MKTEVQTDALVVGDTIEVFDTDGTEEKITKVLPYGFYEVGSGEMYHHSKIRRKKEYSSVKTSKKR